MRTTRILGAASALLLSASLASAQGAGGDIKSLLAGVGTAMRDSQQALTHYKWIEQIQVFKDGESKGTTVNQVQLGFGGQPIKVTLSSPPPPPEKRGFRGRIMKKEMEDTQKYVKEMSALGESYVKPNPAVLQQQLQAGKAWLNPSPDGSMLQLKFSDVQKSGDSLTLSLDTRTKQVRQITASSYLDDPQDVIAVSALFQDLPDGTDYMANLSVSSQQESLQVQVVTLDYTPIGQ